jgi:hypothetical protein
MFALLFAAVIVVFRRYMADRSRYASPSSSGVIILSGGFGGKPVANLPTSRWQPLSRLKKRVLSLSTDLAIGDCGSKESQFAMFQRNSDVERDAGEDDNESKNFRSLTFGRGSAELRVNGVEGSKAANSSSCAERLLTTTRKTDRNSVVVTPAENTLAAGVAAYHRI